MTASSVELQPTAFSVVKAMTPSWAATAAPFRWCWQRQPTGGNRRHHLGGAGADVLDGGTEGAVVDTLTGALVLTPSSLWVSPVPLVQPAPLGTVITDFNLLRIA